MAFTLQGSFVIIFKMLARWLYETEREAWLSNKIASSAKVTNLSTSTSTVTWDGALRMSSNLLHERDKGLMISRLFPKNLSIWRSDVMTVCEDNNDLIKWSRFFTCWRFERTGFSVNNCSSGTIILVRNVGIKVVIGILCHTGGEVPFELLLF